MVLDTLSEAEQAEPTFRLRAPCPPSRWRGSSSINPLGTGRAPARGRAGALEPAAPKGSACGVSPPARAVFVRRPCGQADPERGTQRAQEGADLARGVPAPLPALPHPRLQGQRGRSGPAGSAALTMATPPPRLPGTRPAAPPAPPGHPRAPPHLLPQPPAPEAPWDPRAPPALPQPGRQHRAPGRWDKGTTGSKGGDSGQPLPATTAEP